SETPNSYIVKTFDVTDTKAAVEKLEELTSELGGLDLLILSSGTGDINDKLDFEIEKQTIDTNVLGFTAIADWAFNYFDKNKTGHLVAITSIAGLRGSRQSTSYNATKSYQINYLEGLRQRANKTKLPIFITDIRPGFVDTDMAKGDKLFWVSPADKAARQIYNAIKKRRKIAYITKRWLLIAIVLKLLPAWIYDKI
ncbi:MAG: SDR family NAD(P)-dependent oxidoreductase, partial [Bacteroidetes bacterium]